MQPQNGRLDSWKAIAAYLGRDVTTVIRWERERGLPVHRVPGGKRQAVFALTSEIDAWLVGHAPEPPGKADESRLPPPPVRPRTIVKEGRSRTSWVAAGAAAAFFLSLGAWLYSIAPPPAETAGGPTFVRHDIPLPSPYSVASADLDKDGTLDLAITSYRKNLLFVLAGKRDGTFRLASESGTGIKPDGVVLADFSSDGMLDAVVSNRGSDSVSLFRGTGHGAFRARVDYPAGGAPRALTTADLDRDGTLDLAVVNFDDSTVSIYRGSGGFMHTPEAHRVGTNPYQARVADFDGDGFPDLAVASTNELVIGEVPASHTLTIFRGLDGRRFEPEGEYRLGGGSWGLAVADLNRDARLDLVVSGYKEDVCYLLAGKGDGTFEEPTTVATGAAPLEMAIADLDGDGLQDLVTTNAHDKSVSYLRGRGDGTFDVKIDIPVDTYPKSVALGDWNGDDLLDMVVTNFMDNSVTVLLNTTAQSH